MKARRCQGCGAALPAATSGASMRCPFCGLDHDSAAGGARQSAVTQIHIQGASLKRPIRWLLAIVMLLVAASLVPVIAGLYLGWRVVGTAVTNSTATTPATASSSSRSRLLPSDLGSAAGGTYVVDAAPPSGGFAAVDAVSALPWALTLAQSWSADARLERIDVTRMRPDGTVNVQDDPQGLIRYRFQSPARLAALLEQTRLTTAVRSPVGLFIVVERGTVRAMVNEATRVSERDARPTPTPSVLALPKLVSVPAVERLIEGVPFVSGYAIHLDDEGWVWYFSTLAGEARPRVRARDGAVWPYRRAR